MGMGKFPEVDCVVLAIQGPVVFLRRKVCEKLVSKGSRIV